MLINRRQLLLLTWDLFILLTGIYLSYFARLGIQTTSFFNPHELFQTYTGATVFTIVIHILTYYLFDLYNTNTQYKLLSTFRRLVLSESVALVLIGAAYYFIPNWKFGRGILLIGSFYFVPLCATIRILYSKWFMEVDPSRNAFIVGTGKYTEYFLNEVKSVSENLYNIIGIVDDAKSLGADVNNVKIVGRTIDFDQLIKTHKVKTLIVSNRIRNNQGILTRVIQQKLKGIEVIDVANALKNVTHKLPIKYIDVNWLVDATGFSGINKPLIQKIHRLLDISFSSFGLIITLPITLLSVTLIKLTSKGPIFYKQTRVGFHEKNYEVLKFRTMVADAEKSTGPVQAAAGDPRVTFIGKILRRTRIDEIPQFWNVLIGEMSLIGPRPERPVFVEKYKKIIPYYSLRYFIKPGITGWAQVNYKYGNCDEDALEKLQYDLYYIQEMSLWLDFLIIMKTAQTVISRSGS